MVRRVIIASAVMISCPAAAQTTTYQYDALGRLSGSAVIVNGSSIGTTITYDNAGNRRNYKVTGAPSGGSAGGGAGGGSGSGADPGAGTASQADRRFVVVPLNGFTLIPIG